MGWNLSGDAPIYLQIIEHIKLDIIAGHYKSGERLPSVREFAQIAAVNPNTMQKSLSELEDTGLIYSNRTSGKFVTEDDSLIKQMKDDLAKEYCDDFINRLNQIGYSNEDIKKIINEML